MKTGSRRYAGQSAEQRTTQRREQLIEATIRVLGTVGEPRTTVSAICAAAELTERYFYQSFRNRDAALVAALDLVTGEIASAATRALEETAGSASQRSRAAISTLADMVALQPTRARVLVVESTASEALRERRNALVLWLAGVLADDAIGVFGDRAWPRDRGRLHLIVFITGLAELVAAALRGEVDLHRDTLIETGTSLFTTIAQRPAEPTVTGAAGS